MYDARVTRGVRFRRAKKERKKTIRGEYFFPTINRYSQYIPGRTKGVFFPRPKGRKYLLNGCEVQATQLPFASPVPASDKTPSSCQSNLPGTPSRSLSSTPGSCNPGASGAHLNARVLVGDAWMMIACVARSSKSGPSFKTLEERSAVYYER